MARCQPEGRLGGKPGGVAASQVQSPPAGERAGQTRVTGAGSPLPERGMRGSEGALERSLSRTGVDGLGVKTRFSQIGAQAEARVTLHPHARTCLFPAPSPRGLTWQSPRDAWRACCPIVLSEPHPPPRPPPRGPRAAAEMADPRAGLRENHGCPRTSWASETREEQGKERLKVKGAPAQGSNLRQLDQQNK